MQRVGRCPYCADDRHWPASLLDHERQRVALIQQAQFAIRGFGRRRIEIDATFNRVCDVVGDQRTNVAERSRVSGRLIGLDGI